MNEETIESVLAGRPAFPAPAPLARRRFSSRRQYEAWWRGEVTLTLSGDAGVSLRALVRALPRTVLDWSTRLCRWFEGAPQPGLQTASTATAGPRARRTA